MSTADPEPTPALILEILQCNAAYFRRDLRNPPDMTVENLSQWVSWSIRLQVTSVGPFPLRPGHRIDFS